MTSSATAKQCAACGAPVLHDRAECWSCGEPLAVSAAPAPHTAPIPPVDDYMRPCTACGHVCAVYHQQCPACGAPLSAALPARPNDVPYGWTGELLPDGAVRLQANGMTRGFRTAAGVAVLAALVYLLYSGFAMRPATYSLPTGDAAVLLGLRVLTVLLVLGFVAGAVVWFLFGTEEWEVGADRLVVRKSLFNRRWTREYSGGSLQIETRYGHRGGRTTSLVVYAAQDRATLASDGLGAGSVRALGAFVSRVTGWPFREGMRNWL